MLPLAPVLMPAIGVSCSLPYGPDVHNPWPDSMVGGNPAALGETHAFASLPRTMQPGKGVCPSGPKHKQAGSPMGVHKDGVSMVVM